MRDTLTNNTVNTLSIPITQYSIYARPDNKNRVVKIFSTCFEQKQEGDIFIAQGSGDEFVHTGYYNLFTTDGAHRYLIEDEIMREATEEEIETELVPTKKLNKIELLKTELNKSDYQAIKYAEGWITEVEYAPIREQRQLLRNEINQLETDIIALNK